MLFRSWLISTISKCSKVQHFNSKGHSNKNTYLQLCWSAMWITLWTKTSIWRHSLCVLNPCGMQVEAKVASMNIYAIWLAQSKVAFSWKDLTFKYLANSIFHTVTSFQPSNRNFHWKNFGALFSSHLNSAKCVFSMVGNQILLFYLQRVSS